MIAIGEEGGGDAMRGGMTHLIFRSLPYVVMMVVMVMVMTIRLVVVW